MWTERLIDSRSITSIFGAHAPSLARVTLHELALHRDGPRAIVRFDLPEYPDQPPKKWAAQRFNVVQLQLALDSLEHVEVSGWPRNTPADLDLSQPDELVHLHASGPHVSMTIRCHYASIATISAYRSE